MQVFEGWSGGLSRGRWVYRCGAQREVLPAVSFQPTRGNEAMSMDNIPLERMCSMRNGKGLRQNPEDHPHLEEQHKK